MSSITFTTAMGVPGSSRLRESSALLEAGHFLTMSAVRFSDRVELGLHGDMLQSYMSFTPAQARAVAAELLACADALQGRA
ncbi:MAG: hypothetical protein KDE65_13290 [Burkholderiaceae bacterium]|nr:hypothetical protein [Burkholderiaceae bacterium]